VIESRTARVCVARRADAAIGGARGASMDRARRTRTLRRVGVLLGWRGIVWTAWGAGEKSNGGTRRCLGETSR
jgi:hypothetical protein